MNTTGKIVLTGGALLLLYSLFRKYSAAGSLKFYPASVRGLSFDGATPVMTIGIAAQNTSNQSFTLKSLAGEVYSNNYLVGNVSQFVPVTINPNSETVIYVKIRFGIIGIVNNIIQAFQRNTFTQELQLSAYMNIDNLQTPLELNYKVGA